MPAPPPLIVVLGPTASGKSALGIHLAQALGGEVVACDSTQVYRHFDIGTGTVPAAARHAIPHHLLDMIEPQEEFTAGDYLRRGRAVLDEISARGRVPVVTAGTGLYLRALLAGLSPLPPRSPALRARLRAEAEAEGSEYLHQMLEKLDPTAAGEIAPRDTPKLIRALEVCFEAGQPRTELFRAGREPLAGYRIIRLGLRPERKALYARIEARVEAMLDAGWLEEARRLRDRFGDGVKPFGFLGYKQLAAHLRGELTLTEAIKQAKHETRQFAKRQNTWFRKEVDVRWITGFGDEPAVQEAALVHAGKAM